MNCEIHAYGSSFRGRSHVENGKPLQDCSGYGTIDDHTEFVIVADGVGSSKHSEDAAKLAVDTLESEFKGLKSAQTAVTEETLKQAYQKALANIAQFTAEHTKDPADYDTTLSVAVFNAETGTVVYGQSGDGGIIALRKDGHLEALTEPQKGFEATSVIPLRQESAWVFGKKDGPYVAVLLVTDGMLDQLMPGRLKLTSERIYVRLVSWFADYKFFDHDTDLTAQFQKRLDFVSKKIFESTTDDLSLVVVMNTAEEAAYLNDDYYKEPNWVALEEEWKKRAYPELFRPAAASKNAKPKKARKESKTKLRQKAKNLKRREHKR